MKHFIFIFGLLSFSANAAGPVNPGIIPSITVGNRVYVDLSSKLIVLTGYVSAAAQRYTGLRRTNGTAGYQVTTGKTLTIHSCSGQSAVATGGQYTLGYGDTDPGWNGASAPTNPVYYAGSNNGMFNLPASIATVIERTVVYPVPATKYPFISNVDTGIGGTFICFASES